MKKIDNKPWIMIVYFSWEYIEQIVKIHSYIWSISRIEYCADLS